MEDRWFIQRAGKTYGPATTDELKRLAATGRVQPSDQVRKDGMDRWVKATKVRGLFPETAHQPPPLPTPPSDPLESSHMTSPGGTDQRNGGNFDQLAAALSMDACFAV